MFGDIGSAIIGDDGSVLIEIDPIFSRMCISEKGEYYVFLQNEGSGESYISEKNWTYFIISGTPGLRVAWELKGRQYDLPDYRLDEHRTDEYHDIDYERDALDEYYDVDYEQDAFDDVMACLNMEDIMKLLTSFTKLTTGEGVKNRIYIFGNR